MCRPRDLEPRRIARCGALVGVLSLAASACDTPQAGGTASPTAAASTETSTVFVAFDTTATCQASVAQGQTWAPLDINALVAAPLTVHEQKGTSWSTSHPATGAAWLEVAAAEPCLLPQWAPENIPVDPTEPVYLWLGEEGCERVDPILGSAHDVHDEGYRITAVLPARVQRGGAAEVVDVVRLRSEDGSKRLTIARADLDRCVHSESRPGGDGLTKTRTLALPISGKFGPSPLVVGHERAHQAPELQPVSASLQGVSRPISKAFAANAWSAEGRSVKWGGATPLRIQVRTSLEPLSAPASPSQEPSGEAPNPEHQRLLALVEAERIAVAWASLEARYPSEDAAGYLEAAEARLRRGEAQLKAIPETRLAPDARVAVPEQLTVESVADLDGFRLVSRFAVRTWTEVDASAKQKNRALQLQAAARLRRLADVVFTLRRLLGEGAEAAFVEAGPAAGLLVTAASLVDGPVALVHGWLSSSPGSGVVELPVTLPTGRDCVLFVAESLGEDDTAQLRLDVGMPQGSAFTSLASDRRGVPRPAIRACGLPSDGELVLRVESDIPFAVGMFADGEGVGPGHVLASTSVPLLPMSEGASLDGALGLPEPIDPSESTAEAERLALTFPEQNR